MLDAAGYSHPIFAFGATHKASYTGTAAQTAAVSTKTKAVRIHSTTFCYYAVGSDPTATANDIPLPADVIEYILIGGGQKVSAIQASSAGVISITEVKL